MKTWSEAEVEILKENYNKVSNEELCKLIPNKSFLGIYKKARTLGMRKDPDIEHMNRSIVRKGEKCCSWKGGRKVNNSGYVQVLCPEHERADRNGYVMEHILIFERESGIKIPKNCCVHHINGNRKDNRIQNLCMMTRSAHSIYHNKKRSIHE